MDYGFMQSYIVPMHKIDEGVYLGGLMAANNRDLLDSQGITSLVSALSSGTPLTRHAGMNYHQVFIDDSPNANIAQHLPAAVEFVEKERRLGKKVLIHCAAGISRSSSIAVTYFMAKYGMDYDTALEKVRQGRACATPNMGFENQLRNYNISSIRSKMNL